MHAKPLKVGVFGHYGQNNLGDEATTLAVIQSLQKRIPDIEIIGLSMNPFDTRRRYHIDSFPIRYRRDFFEQIQPAGIKKIVAAKPSSVDLRILIKKILPEKFYMATSVKGFLHLLGNMRNEIGFLRKIREQLKSLDVIMICGSGQLEDFEGPFGYPYTLLKWTLMAKATKTCVFVVSIGAGPPSHSLSYWMLDKTLKRANYLSYRDKFSKKTIEKRITGLNGLIYPDLAHGLQSLLLPEKELKKNKGTVAINPMPVFDNNLMQEAKTERYEEYLNHLKTFIYHVLHEGYAVKLFNTHTSDLGVIENLLDGLHQKDGMVNADIEVVRHEMVQELMQTISEADVVVGTRFHSTVLPLILHKPVMGICYHFKSKELLEDVGLGDYSVDLNDFTGHELAMKFNQLCLNIHTIQKNLEFHHRRYTSLLDEQWDHLATMIHQGITHQ